VISKWRWSSPQPPPRFLSGLMTPGSLAAPEFFVSGSQGISGASRRAADWSSIAYCIDCDLWRHWHACALRPSGRRANRLGSTFPYGTLLVNLTGCSSWRDRAIHDESPGDFAGLAAWPLQWVSSAVTRSFPTLAGDGKIAGRRRVARASAYVGAASSPASS